MPGTWLAATAGESPDATLRRLVATTQELLAAARDRVTQDRRFNVHLPYGPMDWTVLLLHCFWDSWIHERDVLLARGMEHPTDSDATGYATAYGMFIAVAVAAMFGAQVREKLSLGGDGGGVFEVDSSDGITLTATQMRTAGPPAAQVADALAGRTDIAAVLGDLPASSRAALRRWPTSLTHPSSKTGPEDPRRARRARQHPYGQVSRRAQCRQWCTEVPFERGKNVGLLHHSDHADRRICVRSDSADSITKRDICRGRLDQAAWPPTSLSTLITDSSRTAAG